MSTPVHAVLIPGWGATEECWQTLLPLLPGVTPHPLDWSEAARGGPAAVATALAGVPRPRLLIGWSLGAQLALQAALEAPAEADRLILFAGTARFCADADYPGAPAAALRAMRLRLTRHPARVLEDFAQTCFAPDGSPDRQAAYLRQAETFSIDDLALGLDTLARLDVRAPAAALSMPTLLLHGEMDAIIPVANARHLAARLPDARLQTLPGRGHALPFLAAPETAAAIRRFLP